VLISKQVLRTTAIRSHTVSFRIPARTGRPYCPENVRCHTRARSIGDGSGATQATQPQFREVPRTGTGTAGERPIMGPRLGLVHSAVSVSLYNMHLLCVSAR